jgi:hypothetical protein
MSSHFLKIQRVSDKAQQVPIEAGCRCGLRYREEMVMYLPQPLYDAKPYLLAMTGAAAALYLPATGRIGGVLMLAAALMIVYLRRRARAARLARARGRAR